MKVPIGVFGMAAGVAAYPTISRMVAAGNVAEAYGVLCGAVRLMLFATLAAQVCLTLAGFEAVYLIWGMFASRFSVADAEATGTILAFLCLGLGGRAAQTVISRGFYALGSTWLPTIVGTAVAFAAVPLYIVLRRHWGTIGLATASSISITVYVLLLGFLPAPPLRTRGRPTRHFAPRRAGDAGRGAAPRRGGRHCDRYRARRTRSAPAIAAGHRPLRDLPTRRRAVCGRRRRLPRFGAAL